VDVTDEIHRRLEKLESKADPDDLDLEVLARLYLAVGSDKARPILAQLAAESEERQRTAGFVVPTAYLYRSNLWRLAGDDARAREELLTSRELLAPKARSSDQRKPPYLFTLFLLGDDDELLAAGAEFGEKACGEVGWAVVATARAHREGDTAELERRLADWDERAAAEPVDMDGIHPSHRDLRNLLQARYGTAESAADSSSASRPTLTPQVEDVIDGEVLGWWGQYVVAARAEVVTLYDADARSVTYRVMAQSTDVPAWDATGAQFAAVRAAYVLANTPSGLVATMLRPGGSCSIAGPLLAVDRGFDATVYRADGTELAVGRWPAALAPAGDAFAMGTKSGMLRIARLDADLGVRESVDIDQQCSALAWFPDGTRLVCGVDASQTVRTVGLASGEVLDEAALHYDDPIVGVAAAPSGANVASVGLDGVLGVRRLDPPLSLSLPLGERLEALSWDATGELIAVLGDRGWFVLTAQGERLDLEPATSLAWHPTERRLAVGRGGQLNVLAY